MSQTRGNIGEGEAGSGLEGGNAVGSQSKDKVINKNAAGQRSDVGWNHGVSIDGNARKIKCKYCEKTITRGVYRLKHHLAGTQKDVGACTAVSDEVKKQMWGIVVGLQEKLVKKTKAYEASSSNEEEPEVGEKRKGKEVEKPGNIFKKKLSTQATINNMFKKNLREDACQAIADFFYNNAIPFNVARSEEFTKMFESVARHGLGFKPPSYHELRVKYLKQKVEFTMQSLEEHRAQWKKTGCTIMTDGWTDKRRRTIINFLVNSTKGTVFLKSIDASHISKTAEKIFKMIDEVVEEVGEENVVQVVTDNAANYKAAGDMLMRKRERLYWTPCAAHCIDLMLEDFEKRLPVHKETIVTGRKITTYIYGRTSLIVLLQHFTKGKDLIRPGMTRFATSYLTLGSLYDNKGALIRMFTSDQWKANPLAKTNDGKLIENVILDKGFWRNIVICLKGAYPLIKVLRLVDSDEKPAMGYIYEEMDRAKEKIQSAFNGVSKSYMPIWEIIADRWDNQLHRPLHAAGYYLNPQLHYSPGFKVDYEVKRGLYDCMEGIVGSKEEITKIDAQLEDFKNQTKFFAREVAKAAIKTKTPAQWWDSYGDEHPELQKFAIRVLSLTCSSSGCERNWSAFEMVHTKRRNRLKQKTMNDVVFVMTNSKLAKKKQARKAIEYNSEELSSDDEWIANRGDDEEGFNLDHLEIPSEDTLGVVGEEASVGGSNSLDDLEIPSFEDEDIVDDVDGLDGGGENEGNTMELEEDDIDDADLNDLL